MATSKVYVNKAATTVEQWEIAALTTAPATLRTSTGKLKYLILDNTLNAATTYFKLYNKASAPVHATDSPDLVWPILAGKLRIIQLAAAAGEAASDEGETFANGIHVCASTGKDTAGGSPAGSFNCTVGLI